MSNKYPGGLITSGANAGYSVAFDGSGDALTYPNNTAFAFGTGAFTIEFWINGPSNDSTFILGGRSAIGTMHITTGGTTSSTTVSCLRYVGSSTITTGSTLITNNSWNHCAIVRDGSSNITLYVNGVSAGTGTDTTNYTTTSGTWYIGQNDLGNSNYLQGNLSNLRIVKGTALYTAAFRPPTQLLNVTNTSLLTCNSPAIVDQSSNNFTITANGNAAVSTFTPFTGTQLVPNPNTLANTQGVWSISDAAYWMSQNKWPMPPNYPLQSLRFNRADSANLSRTFAAAPTVRTKQTISFWTKRSGLGTLQIPFAGYDGSSAQSSAIYFTTGDTFGIDIGGAATNSLVTTQVFRDPSSWYHIVVSIDTTQATSSNRVLIYVNGVQVTAFGTANYPSQNATTQFLLNNANNRIGSAFNNTSYFDGYITDLNVIDGQALTPSSFGANDPNTGVWSPVPYSGTYGTNGFRLSFQDNTGTTATTLGKDYSGNGNNWTPNNFSVAAGSGNDSLTDGPTNWGIDYGNGGEVRGNYATLNPLGVNGAAGTFSNGNLDYLTQNTDQRAGVATIPCNTGGSDKWYCEITIGSKTNTFYTVGVFSSTVNAYSNNPVALYRGDGLIALNGVSQGTFASYTQNDIIAMSYNNSNGELKFYKNNTLITTLTLTSSTLFFFGASSDSSGNTANYSFNFGQRPFAYPAPPGFKVLCTTNLPIPTVGATSTTLASKQMDVVLYTGNSTNNRVVSGYNFAPDLVWVKSRSNTTNHGLFDILRSSGTAWLGSNLTDGETTTPNFGGLNSLTSDGFTTKNGGTDNTITNQTGYTYAAWAWKANGAGSSNTAGSITSTVSANQTAGISIVTYTGTGANATVGHGLGVAPRMMIFKNRSSAIEWQVYHASIGNGQYGVLNSTAAFAASGIWQNTTPTSTVFSIGNFSGVNTNGNNYVAYCFAEIAGFSKFGSYTGNGSTDGPFIYCGFRPRWIMWKKTNSSTNAPWVVVDTSRSPYNLAREYLLPNASDAEASVDLIDVVSNGFKWRGTAPGGNNSGDTYIFAAFAEAPFNYSRAR